MGESPPKTYLLCGYLKDLKQIPMKDLLEQRYQKFRRMGVFDEGPPIQVAAVD